MSTVGVYGTRVPSNVSQRDIEIYYSYRPTLDNTNDGSLTFKKLSSTVLVQATRSTDDNEQDTILEGMYNLNLPLSEFGKKGFYTVYIKPREIKAIIADVGKLASYNDVKGIVVDSQAVVTDEDAYLFSTNNALVGYRVIYINADGSRSEDYRLVTSNNRCEPLTQNVITTNEKSIAYRYNENSSLTFITVTPSTASSFKTSVEPYIGRTSQQILLVNTKFEPIAIEIEMVDHDADTISNMIEGSQLRDLDNGLVTTYNENDEIYHQSQHYTLKDEYTSTPIFEVKKNKVDDIDFTQTITDK